MEAAAHDPPRPDEAAAGWSRLWWLWLIAGVAWIFIALVVLQFDRASITTVGVLIGLMFLLSGVQQLVLAMGPSGPPGSSSSRRRTCCWCSPGSGR